MLFSTTTSVYSGLSSVASAAFNDFWPYLVMVIGIPLAFFIIEMLIDLIPHAPKTGYYSQSGERAKDQDTARAVYDVQTKGIWRKSDYEKK